MHGLTLCNFSVRINVIGYDEKKKKFYPISMTKNQGPVMTVLQITNDDKTHFVFVQNLNTLLRPTNSRNSSIVYCPRYVCSKFYSGYSVLFTRMYVMLFLFVTICSV